MKYSLLLTLLCPLTAICQDKPDTAFLQPIELTAIRAADKTPVAKTNLSKKEIEKQNTGQDLPFILDKTPAVVVNADAGNGIGYTGIRLRGSDGSRINFTLNGIPYNDAESQGTFFVNIPDIASSASAIQVQRGVGTSTNGAGAFGGSINVNTNEPVTVKGMEFNNTVGSYNSFKNTLVLHSGILAKHFTFDGRLSQIRSDGYIDRASSRLKSFYGSAAYLDQRNSVRLNIFSGKEKTYQAWNGIDAATLQTNRRYNSSGTEKPGEPYDNETDNYTQTHYQLFLNHKFNAVLKANIAAFLTRGKGYYEQYKADESLGDYGLPDYQDGPTLVTETDLIRRLWLDNYFYGTIFSLQYEKVSTQVIWGGGWNQYDGEHFGEVIWAKVQPAVPQGHRWYALPAKKQDLSSYIKWTEKLDKRWQSFVDLQVRHVSYTINGFRYNPQLVISRDWTFFNPKAGIGYSKGNSYAYVSYGRAAKEPNRDDFEATPGQQPKAEKLQDLEAGFENKYTAWGWSANLYYMWYKDQLVLTGRINDVGAYTRTNIPESYRAGVELQAYGKLNKWLSLQGNISLSKNKIKNFTEFIYDENGNEETRFYKNPDIAFSPAVVSSVSLIVSPIKQLEFTLSGKYVGKQYLDNTSQDAKSLSSYYVQDMRVSYSLKGGKFKESILFVQANNVLSKQYEANGYTYSYLWGGTLYTENFYFPMAPINIVAGLNIKL